LQPQREDGRQRVAELMEAAASVIQERGFEATTMAEIAARADAKIGSLYRFFPNKDAVADALMEHYTAILKAQYDPIIERAKEMKAEALADVLIDLLLKLHPQTRAIAALLDSRSDWSAIRLGFRRLCLSGIKAALKACAENLDDGEADDIAAVVLNNMKTLVRMTRNEAPTSPGAPDELRLMNRLYLASKLSRGGARVCRASDVAPSR
jgi:AcrR family transcriptional regulator